MFKGQRILALIPARGGSKGLPGKNIRNLHGKPLIAWSIEAAMKSNYIDRIIVSTDSADIATIAEEYGAEIPFMRPTELAADNSSGIDVCLHALEWYSNKSDIYDLLLILQPTSPLRTASDIDAAIETLGAKQAKAVVSVCETDHHPWWSSQLPQDGNMENFIRPEVLNKNRQELPNYYRLNGAIYLIETKLLRKTHSFYGPDTFAYIMPPERSIDIDSLPDLLLAEAYLAK
ncbi:acylneuraminate cytidylyltransferase family protein [Desulfopila inferna]|uniref:acylneuraminate cytidylyltransferase family protein n=1 Tax=Desulfopila inferna TaxID=468528 RepID=UPI0019637DC8|nr:acylneuraminate cytidylyltransferase family protein [Desulfopila inferna]MBM9603017.1 acylneuraminate cytidylyltransferase family protein [Desulfopila inferna]